ncbi:tetratricopeptide repeat protein [Amycolatopsis japonica]
MDSGRAGHVLTPVDEAAWNRALVVETLGDNALRIGDFDRAAELFLETADATTSDPVSKANAQIGLGDADRARGKVDQASRWYEAAVHNAASAGYRFGRLRALVPLGHLALHHHSAVRARDAFTEAAALAEELGDSVYQGNAMLGLAECDERDGRTEEARTGYERAHEVFVASRTLTGQAHAAQRLGALYHRMGRADLARDWLVEAARSFGEDNDPVGMVNTLEGLGDILLDVGDPDLAEVQYRAARKIALERGLSLAEAHSTQNLARVAAARGHWPVAEDLFASAIVEYRKVGDLLGLCTALGKRAWVRGHSGRLADALDDRVAAVFAIEQFRAANRDALAQNEYRARFATVYAEALRTAVATGSAERFAVIADGLAGRRLPGLADADVPVDVTDNVFLLQHLVIAANQKWLAMTRGDPASGFQEGISHQERVRRLLGNVAIRSAMPDMAEGAVEDLLAAVYLPPADDGADLIAELPAGCHALQLVRDPVNPELVHRLWRDDHQQCEVDTVELRASCTELLGVLQEDSERRSDLRPGDLLALSALLPEGLRRELATGTVPRLLLMPVGELWLVPWGAVPVGERLLLAQAAEYVVCPSMALQRVLRNRERPRSVDGPVRFWRSPVMRNLHLTALRDDPSWRFEGQRPDHEAKTVLGSGTHTAVVLCHGRLANGPGHYLELDHDSWLVPADVLGPEPPTRLYLITCWGAGVPGQEMTDPVTIATLALARGSAEVLATVGEFGDTPVGDLFAQSVLVPLADATIPASTAIHEASKRFLAQPGAWEWVLRDWAPLLPIGTFAAAVS